ncbi:MAG TPA: DUF4864 domain-containing protein [Bauldia sp.]|nr:DUF4864 domain-containing protein [Bauldia sp.]
MNRIAGVLVAIALTFTAAAARADDFSGGDRAAIQSLITGQIEAFRVDDGAKAWGYASSTIQSIYTTPDAFMAMVRNGYQPVYRPQSVTFGDLMDTEIGPIQKVYITGPDGKPYIAAYGMQRQSDGSWKINGCSLQEDDTPSI